MNPNIFVYLSGPMTGRDGYTKEENVAAALKVYFELIARGIPTYCPHLNGVIPSAWDIGWNTWLAFDEVMVTRCTHVVMLPRWTTSPGAVHEHTFAQMIGRPVYYMHDLDVESVIAFFELVSNDDTITAE